MISRTFLASAAVCVLAACASSGPPAPGAAADLPIPIGVEVENFDRPYDVRGRTAAELARQIGTQGPVRNGRRFSGELTWILRYRYGSIAAMVEGCVVRDVRVAIETITIMPQWVNADSADASLRAQWAAYLSALRLHEDGHRRIALEAAVAVRRRLEDLRGTACQNYAGEAKFHFDRLIVEYNARNVAYDSTTRHGFTQGTIWPPRQVRPAGNP